jgi:hydroxymethylpyrimidine pyrophosphatase-like HAD family hydrolase
VPFISTFNGTEDRLYYHSLPNDGMQWYCDNRRLAGDRRLCQVDRLQGVFADNVVAFTVINTRQQLINLAMKMREDFSDQLQMHFFENPYSPPWHWLTIHDKKACKSEAVRELLSYTGFELKDLVVFGDNLNDVNMFKMSPRAVAVSNASDQIKRLSTEVIGANTDDSVVKYVMEAEGIA